MAQAAPDVSRRSILALRGQFLAGGTSVFRVYTAIGLLYCAFADLREVFQVDGLTTQLSTPADIFIKVHEFAPVTA